MTGKPVLAALALHPSTRGIVRVPGKDMVTPEGPCYADALSWEYQPRKTWSWDKS